MKNGSTRATHFPSSSAEHRNMDELRPDPITEKVAAMPEFERLVRLLELSQAATQRKLTFDERREHMKCLASPDTEFDS